MYRQVQVNTTTPMRNAHSAVVFLSVALTVISYLLMSDTLPHTTAHTPLDAKLLCALRRTAHSAILPCVLRAVLLCESFVYSLPVGVAGFDSIIWRINFLFSRQNFSAVLPSISKIRLSSKSHQSVIKWCSQPICKYWLV